MEVIDGKTCISFEELTGRIITTANLQALVRKKQVRRVQKGGNGRVALYEVDSLPLKWRTKVYKRFPDLKEQAESREFIDTITQDGAAFDYFQGYILADGRHLPDDKVLEYSSNAAIMNAFRRCWEAHVSKRHRTGKKSRGGKRILGARGCFASAAGRPLPSLPAGQSAPSANEDGRVCARRLRVLYLRQIPERQRRQGADR